MVTCRDEGQEVGSGRRQGMKTSWRLFVWVEPGDREPLKVVGLIWG